MSGAGHDIAGDSARSGIAIDGVIRDKRDIAGVPYATISVGAADDVQQACSSRWSRAISSSAR